MLDLLKQNNTSNYVTRQELQELINRLTQMDKLIGPKGEDAYVDKEMLEDIIQLSKPSHKEVLDIIKPLIPEPIPGKDGKDGNNGVDGNTITSDEIIQKIRSHKGEHRLVVDNIKGMKKYIARINELSNHSGQLQEDWDECQYQLGLLEKQIHAVTRDIAANSGISAKETCETGPPTEDGSPGDKWFDSVNNRLYEWVCDQWVGWSATPLGTQVCVGIGTAAIGSTFEVGCLGNGGTVLPGQLQAPTVDGSVIYNQPEITGVCPVDGNTITILRDGVEITPGSVCTAGMYSVTPDTAIPDGTYDFTVVQTDTSGSVSNPSPATNATIATNQTGIGVMSVEGTFIVN